MGFINSSYDPEKSHNTWDIQLFGKTPDQNRAGNIKLEPPYWPSLTQTIIPYIPSILFFPNFLFEFPERIYLNPDLNDEVSNFYRVLLQDLLDSLENGTNVEAHILERAKSGSANDKRNLDGLLLEMSREVSSAIFSAWDKMFHQKMTRKRVVISCQQDESKGFFINFQLEDNDGFYEIRERSLGFRWFFVFLLLTHYRASRKHGPSEVLFLFDEPASNLHQTAQQQLLRSFEALSQGCHIIYTTHSHHMINPCWLESTFVVKNEGLDYGKDAMEYSAKKTNISVTKYRQFVTKHPDQTNYFKPILDVLEYRPSSLENVPNVVMTEGKTDYYLLSLLAKSIGEESGIYFLPGGGAGSLDCPIQLYLAWVRTFVVLLDADGEGEKQRSRYIDKFGVILTDRVFLLSEVLNDSSIRVGESLLTAGERLSIQQQAYSAEPKYKKVIFHRAVQEILMAGATVTLSESSTERVRKLIEAFREQLSKQEGKKVSNH